MSPDDRSRRCGRSITALLPASQLTALRGIDDEPDRQQGDKCRESADCHAGASVRVGPRKNGGSMSKSLPSSFWKSTLFGDNMGLDDGPNVDLDEQSHPVEKIWQRGPIEAALKSASGASVVLDLPLPASDGVDADGEFWKAPKIVRYDPGALAKASRASDERFARLTAIIQNFFGNHTDLAEEAVATCRKAREDARAEVVANTVVPTRDSAVTPNAPRVLAVTRAGQMPVERPEVPLRFQHLVKVEED